MQSFKYINVILPLAIPRVYSYRVEEEFWPRIQYGVRVEVPLKNKLYSALSTLDARSQDIVNARWLSEPKATLHDLAARYSISAERVRQLESNAIKKLQSNMD